MTTQTPIQQYVIRPIEAKDNQAVFNLVIEILTGYGAVGEGYACNDPELKEMYHYYQSVWGAYSVVEDRETGQILGAGGYEQLKGTEKEDAICELQKLYFLPALRGKGLGKQLLAQLIEEASEDGFKQMYLETIPPMESAQALYRKFGFVNLPEHRGNTGHQQNCSIYMIRDL